MPNNKITNLGDKRPSVYYSVNIEHRWDGTFGLSIEGIGDNPSERSKNSVASALLEAIKLIDSSVLAAHPGQPEPRAEAKDDDKVCADRYRWVRAHFTRLVAMPHEGPNVDIVAIGEIGDDDEGKSLDLIVDAARTGASS